MPGKKAKEKDPEAEPHEELSTGPSVAAHPRAALHVARAKGWAGLAGFLVGGYLSLPTTTLAVAGLRALVAGIICYVVAWAGAVFVWRQLVILEIGRARARASERIASIQQGASGGPAGRTWRRQNVRVKAERPVIAYVGAERKPAQTFTIDISAGGLLVSGLADLQKGEPFEFELALVPGAPPVTGTGTVVRTDPQGRCAIVFKQITRADERRLDQFVFEHLRNEAQGAAA
jgi:PilZ domain